MSTTTFCSANPCMRPTVLCNCAINARSTCTRPPGALETMRRETTGGVSGGTPGGVCGAPGGAPGGSRRLPLKDENSLPCHVLDDRSSLEVRCAIIRRGSREAPAVLDS